MSISQRLFILLFAATLLTACGQHYVTPGGAASMFDLIGEDAGAQFRHKGRAASLLGQTDKDLRAYYRIKPAANFPANIAVIRVQDSGYQSYSYRIPGYGRFTIITTRDIESAKAFDSVLELPGIQQVMPIGRMLVRPNPNTIKDLRVPAARLQADMLLIYTVDTAFSVDGKEFGPLALISLGLIPNKKAHVTATVSGMLVDVRTGFVYAAAEATDLQQQRASIWSTGQAIDTARLKAEKLAFSKFVDEFTALWPGVVDEHHGQTAAHVPSNGGKAQSKYHVIRFENSQRP